jgi:hypothetical protein
LIKINRREVAVSQVFFSGPLAGTRVTRAPA